jgi:TPR repeat protein
MCIWRRNTSITYTFVCWNSGMRPPLHAGLVALLFLAGCPTRDAKPLQTVASDSRAPANSPPAEASEDARAAPDALAAPPATSAPAPLCDAGAECTALGKQAFDQKRYLDAHQLFERSCQLDDALGCKWLALDLKDANDPRIPADPSRVAPTLEKACALGELQACWMLGNGYLYGNRSGVVTPDPTRAVALYQKGCDGGEPGSCSSLADCYAEGEGVAKDRALARKYRKRAEELGFVGE